METDRYSYPRISRELRICLYDKFYEDSWKKIMEANTKLKTYYQIYNNCENLPTQNLSSKSIGRKNQKTVSS